MARAVAMTTAAARAVGFDERRVSAVATAASEVTRNVVKYAGQGQFSVTTLDTEDERGVRLVARDRGPGIADIEAALRDHYSTGGTLGLGLPGVRRLMDELEVDARPGGGTTVTATMWLDRPKRAGRAGAARRSKGRHPFIRALLLPAGPPDAAAAEAAARIRPHQRERVSGDAVTLRWVGHLVLVALIDALGHGPNAADIAARGIGALGLATPDSPLEALEVIHEALRQTDGAAAAAALVDPQERTFRAAAVGNVRIRLLGSVDRRLEWTEGTIGVHYRRPQERSGRLGDDALVLYSDGVSDRFELENSRMIGRQDPAVVARDIIDRFGKDHDDAACVVARCPR